MYKLIVATTLLIAGTQGVTFEKVKNFGKKIVMGEELDFNIMGEYNINAYPQLFGRKKKDDSTQTPIVPTDAQLKIGAINAAQNYVEKADKKKLNRQVVKFGMTPVLFIFSNIAGLGASVANRPNFNKRLINDLANTIENDPGLLDVIFESLEQVSSQDPNSGEIIRDVVIKPYTRNKSLVKYVKTIASGLYEQNPHAAKIFIDRLLLTHSKHNIISDDLAKELKEISDNVKE